MCTTKTRLIRRNSSTNPIVFKSKTIVFQPKGIPFQAQSAVSLQQAKIIALIMSKLKEPIKSTIENRHYQNYPQQLSIFTDSMDSKTIQLDFEMKEFKVEPQNYKKLIDDITSLQTFIVQRDTVYFNSRLNAEVDAEQLSPLIYKVLKPKKYERFCSIVLEKDIVELLINVKDVGYSKYWLEVVMEAQSKHTFGMYQLISAWEDKGGFEITIDNLKEFLGIQGKYVEYKSFNQCVLKRAYEDLHEKANIWFEYRKEDKNGKPHKIVFKIIQGFVKIEKPSIEEVREEDVKYVLDLNTISAKEKEAYYILRDTILISDNNILGEIISNRLQEFHVWYEQQQPKFRKMDNIAANLLYYLQMTSSYGWKATNWDVIGEETKQEIQVQQQSFLDEWNKVLIKLESLLDTDAVQVWFKDCFIHKKEEDDVYIQCPSSFVIQMIEDRYCQELATALKLVFKSNIRIFYNC